MKSKDYISQLGFDQIEGISEVDYMDECIAFHTDIREMPLANGSLRMDMVTIVGCAQGKMQGELNAVSYTIQQNELIACRPNDVITGCMLNPDFRGMVLCMSRKGCLEQFPERELWDKAFRLSERPVVKVSPESLQMLKHYGEALRAKLRCGQGTPYRREIVMSLVKAVMYELMGNVDESRLAERGCSMGRQREVLFKRFMELLAGTQVKPRCVSNCTSPGVPCLTSRWPSRAIKATEALPSSVW